MELLPIGLMLLLAAMPMLFDVGDDRSDDEPEPRPEPEPEPEPNLGLLFGTEDDDFLTAGPDTTTIQGLGGDDTITSDADFLDIFIDGGAGDDTVTTGGGASVLGGNGDDTITTLAFSTIDGGAGDDVIAGVEESHILGGAGNDVIAGNTFGSTVDGGAGNDVIDAGIASTITTGSGSDAVNIQLDLPLAGDTWNAGPVTVTDYVAGQDTYFLNNNVNFDFFTGEPLPNGVLDFVEEDDGVSVTVNGFGFVRLEGVTLADVDPDDFVLDPPAPETLLTGTAGADVLTAGESTTSVLGLGGDDTITSTFEFLPVTIDAGDGNDTVDIRLGGTVFAGNGDDTIDTDQDSVIYGGAGDDTIFVDDGTTITSGTGTDTLIVPLSSNSTFDFPAPTVTDYVAGQDIYLLTGTVTDAEGNPTGSGELTFNEDEDGDGVWVRVDGRGIILLEGITLAEVDPGDFVLDPPPTVALLTGTGGVAIV